MIQDNKSAKLLENNGKRGSRIRTRHFLSNYFITDQIEKHNLKVGHCSTENMDAYFMTKPIQGDTFTNPETKL